MRGTSEDRPPPDPGIIPPARPRPRGAGSNLLEMIADPDQARNEFVEDIVEEGYDPEASSVDALNLELRDSG